MKIFLLILAIVGTSVGLEQHGKIRTLRVQIDSYRTSLAEVQAMGTQLDRAQPVSLTETQIATLRAEKAELMQLRAGLPKLREQARSTNEIAAEIEKLNADAAQHQASARAIEVTFVEEQRSKAIRGVLEQFGMFLRVIRDQARRPLPRSLAELENFFATEPEPFPGFQPMWTNMARSYPPFHISRDSFEFVPASGSSGGPLLLRERLPHKLADGQWTRHYLRTNLQPVQSLQPTEDFSAWEARQ